MQEARQRCRAFLLAGGEAQYLTQSGVYAGLGMIEGVSVRIQFYAVWGTVMLSFGLLLIALPASAIRQGIVTLTCPLTGEKFRAEWTSGGVGLGTRLDLRQEGIVVSPLPLQTCPDSGFPLFDTEFSPQALETLKAFVQTPEYKALRAAHTDYYVTAMLQEKLGYPAERVTLSVLSAAWEAEDNKLELEAFYLDEARRRFLALVRFTDRADAKWPGYYFQTIELARRLGMFDEAETRFIAERETLAKTIQIEFIELEAQLIMARETKPDSPFRRRLGHPVKRP